MKHATLAIAALLATVGRAQLIGDYTVGGTVPPPDLPSIAAAVDTLNSVGRSGNVTFLIRPGTYTGQYQLGPIAGPGVVTFRSETWLAASVILEHDASSSADNYIFELDGAERVTFQSLTFNPLDYDHARAIHFFNNTDQFNIRTCVFNGSPNPSSIGYADRVLVQNDQADIGTDLNADNVGVQTSYFNHGSTAVDLRFYDPGGAYAHNVVVLGNHFLDQVGMGVQVRAANGLIEGNWFKTTLGDNYTGMRASDFNFGGTVRMNRVHAQCITGSCTGIEVRNTATLNSHISNNMITMEGSGDTWGLVVDNLFAMHILNNSVANFGGTPASSAFHHESDFADGQSTVVRSNLFANYGSGTAYSVAFAGNVSSEDHNDLFSTSGVLATVQGSDYTDLASYQTATGQGAADVSIDPAYPLLPDLHINSCVLSDLGECINFVPIDIDEEPHGSPVCDMGADEYTFSGTFDAGTIDITTADLPYTLSAPAGSGYLWNQGAATPSIEVIAPGPYACLFTDVNGCTYTIQWMVDVDFSTGVDEANLSGTMGVFPNPALEGIRVPGVMGRAPFTLYDASGREVLRGVIDHMQPIDVTGLMPGAYLLRTTQEGMRTVRFVKQ